MKTATSFSAACALCCFLFSATLAWGQDTNFVRKNTWYFENFGDSTVSWDLFRENYIGIPPNYNDAFYFDRVLFDEVYTKMLGTGHCFGMSLLALQLLRYGGYDGFCSPASQYPRKYTGNEYREPADPRLFHSIQMMQGHLLNFRVISNMLDIIAENKNRDGGFAFDRYKFYEAKKEYCLIGVTENFDPAGEAHALLPYFATDDGAGNVRIYVYDVNRPFNKPGPNGHDWYTGGQNFVQINTNNNTWSYDMADTCACPWSGSPSGGLSGSGNIFIFPFSIMRSKDRLPQSIFADAAEAIGKIFILSQDAQVEQLSTPDGRRYLQSGVQELETSDSVALRSVLPFISLNGGQPDKDAAQLYFVRGESALDLALKGGAAGYSAQFFSDYTSIKVESSEPGAIEQICVRGWHSPLPTVEIRRADGQPPTGKVEITQLVSPEGQ
jgi:hypothetical protein